jgi:ATP-binding cassette subfamily B multidrug efflux pump
MFRYFENLLPPFPPEEPVEPPKTLVGFCLHYTKGAWPFILMSAVLTALIGGVEVWLFGMMGQVVDWLSSQNRETFLQTEGWKLLAVAFLILIIMPVIDWSRLFLNQQTLMGNYPMRIRWQVHRYLLQTVDDYSTRTSSPAASPPS